MWVAVVGRLDLARRDRGGNRRSAPEHLLTHAEVPLCVRRPARIIGWRRAFGGLSSVAAEGEPDETARRAEPGYGLHHLTLGCELLFFIEWLP